LEHVILVNEEDAELGTMEKLEAHKKGLLHRAFSIILFNSKGELLLQKRSLKKYHSGGLWTNTCCSHPLPGEVLHSATKRKLFQEMGIDLQPQFAFKFIYKAALDNDLIEHECDHVFVGHFNEAPILNPDEAMDWKYISLPELKTAIKNNPEQFSSWFKMILEHPEFRGKLNTLAYS
jgi:isopentenyl-diphosphate delta-isomerase